MLVILFLVLYGFITNGDAAPPVEHNSRSFRNALNQQGLQTILQSIEERLRNLDQVYSIRYAPRADLNTDQFMRKIELLETKLTRMESQIEAQMEKISENMSSKNFKDDIAKDQLFRKIDSVYERVNHKISYVEGKLDMDILKLQTKIETAIAKVERLDHSFSVRQADMESEISEAVEIMENVKNNVAVIENKLLNITQKSIETTINKQINLVENKFENVTNKIEQIERRINSSLEQCYQKDFLNDFANKDMHLSKAFKGYEDQIQSYGNKVNNMYNELWKKSTTIENTIKNSVLLMNLTRKEIQDMKKSGNKITTTNNNQNNGQLDMIVNSFTHTIQRKFAELGNKLESNFENVMLAQNLFLESCHRIQMDESQLENKISLVLETLLDAVNNRSVNTFKEIQSVEELIKTHDNNVYRTMNLNTNTIIKLSEKTSEDRKKLEKMLSSMKKDIGNAIENMRNQISTEDQDNSQKFDTIAGILLELQEQVNDLDNRLNEDNINYNAKQMLQDILLVTKALPNKETITHQLNTLNNMDSLSKLMTHIYHLLVAIDTKINKSYLDYQPGAHHAELHHNININKTKDCENVTNCHRKENGKVKILEDNELVDVILEILPEESERVSPKNSMLSRFNYTIITDEKLDEISTIREQASIVSDNKNYENNDKIIINGINNDKSSTNIPEDSTVSYSTIFFNKNYENSDKVIINGINNYKSRTNIPEASTVSYSSIFFNKNFENNDKIIINGINNDKSRTKFPEASTVSYSTNFVNKNYENNDEIIIDGINNDATNINIQDVTTISYKNNKNYENNGDIIINTNFDSSAIEQNKEINETTEGIKINKNKNETIENLQNKGNKISPATYEQTKQKYLVTNNENEKNSGSLNKNASSVTDTTEYDINKTGNYTNENNRTTNKKEFYIKENTTSKDKNNNNTNTTPVYKKIDNVVSTSSTIADIMISDTTVESEKIESVTKQKTEMFDDIIYDNIENSTLHTQNSFEYPDLINNTTYENNRDEYEWNYED